MEETKYSNKKGFIKNIAFFGDADITETDETYTYAFKVAEILAQEKWWSLGRKLLEPVPLSSLP